MGYFGVKENDDMFGKSNQIQRNYFVSARYNIFAIVLFSVINVAMCLLGMDSYFLFSAIVPYFVASIGAYWGGLYAPEFYVDSGMTEADFMSTGFVVACAAVAIVIIALYLVCGLLCKKHVAFMIAALALFVIDTIMMPVLYGISMEWILDYVFHAWVLISLTAGVVYHFRHRA